jgi:hypothetical protein
MHNSKITTLFSVLYREEWENREAATKKLIAVVQEHRPKVVLQLSMYPILRITGLGSLLR